MNKKGERGKARAEAKVRAEAENRAEAKVRAETEGGKVWKAGSETAVWPERGKGKEER